MRNSPRPPGSPWRLLLQGPLLCRVIDRPVPYGYYDRAASRGRPDEQLRSKSGDVHRYQEPTPQRAAATTPARGNGIQGRGRRAGRSSSRVTAAAPKPPADGEHRRRTGAAARTHRTRGGTAAGRVGDPPHCPRRRGRTRRGGPGVRAGPPPPSSDARVDGHRPVAPRAAASAPPPVPRRAPTRRSRPPSSAIRPCAPTSYQRPGRARDRHASATAPSSPRSCRCRRRTTAASAAAAPARCPSTCSARRSRSTTSAWSRCSWCSTPSPRRPRTCPTRPSRSAPTRRSRRRRRPRRLRHHLGRAQARPGAVPRGGGSAAAAVRRRPRALLRVADQLASRLDGRRASRPRCWTSGSLRPRSAISGLRQPVRQRPAGPRGRASRPAAPRRPRVLALRRPLAHHVLDLPAGRSSAAAAAAFAANSSALLTRRPRWPAPSA